MKKLRDIICSRANYDEMYNPQESCIGTILIQENNTFEGIMMDYDRTEESFIFGRITEEDTIEVVRASTTEELPRAYKGAFEDNKYRGDYSVRTAYYEYPISECQISIIDPYWYREPLREEQFQIETHKEHFIEHFSKETRELYRQIIQQPKKVKIKRRNNNSVKS